MQQDGKQRDITHIVVLVKERKPGRPYRFIARLLGNCVQISPIHLDLGNGRGYWGNFTILVKHVRRFRDIWRGSMVWMMKDMIMALTDIPELERVWRLRDSGKWEGFSPTQ